MNIGPFPWDSDVLDTSSSESGSVRSAGVDKSSHTSSKKRKRASTVGSDHLATPARSDDDLETSLDDPSHHDTTANESHSHHRNPEDLPEFLDESLADTANVFTGNDQDFIQIAQLVADQKILQNEFLQYAVSSPKSPSDLHLANEPEHFATAFKEALEDIIPGIQRCNLKGLSDLDAWPSMNVSTASTATEKTDKLGQPQLRSRVGKNQVDAFQKTQVPYLSVQRGKDAMEVLPPALYFWEELGLSPVQLNRDVVAYLIYPDDGTVREAASAFLMSMENYYQSCRFGRHTCGTKLGKNGDGLVPMPVSSAEPESVFRGLDRVCESIGNGIMTACR